MSERLIFMSKYGKNGPKLSPEAFPKFKHITPEFKVVEIRIAAVGRVEKNGKKYEFHDLHVLLEEK